MPAYLIGDVTVNDPTAYDEYRDAIRFRDKASIRGYLNDPLFHKLGALRQRAITSRIVMADGVD